MSDDSTQQSGFYASRPTIRIDGQAQDSLGDVLLQSLLVEETTLGLFRCEASFQNWGPKNDGSVDFLFFDQNVIDFGKTLSVEFGPPGSAGPVFAGRVTGIEATYAAQQTPELLVLAEDRFQDLRMERRTRSFENVTDADVIRQIASQQGLTAQVDVDGPTYRVLAQLNQSDLAFLRERVAAIDAELWIDNRTLYAQARTRRSSGAVSFTYGQGLIEFSVTADLAHQRSTVQVSGWDVAGKQAIDVQSGESAIASELNGGTSGSAILGRALTARNERVVTAMPLTQAEAQAMADARYRARARSFVKGRGAVEGNVKVRVGSILDLSGLGPVFDGKYYVTQARHTFTLQEGYRTTFEAERPSIGG